MTALSERLRKLMTQQICADDLDDATAEIERQEKQLAAEKYAADNYRLLLDESDHEYAELKDEVNKWKTSYSNAMDVNIELRVERDALIAENDKLSDLWSAMKAERDALRAAAQAGLKKLLKYPRETRTVWKDGIDLDLPYPNKPLDNAITQLQAALEGKS